MMMTRSTAALFCLTISRRRHCEIMRFLCIVHTNKVLKVYVLCFQVNVESTSAAENKSLSTLEEKSGRMKRSRFSALKLELAATMCLSPSIEEAIVPFQLSLGKSNFDTN